MYFRLNQAQLIARPKSSTASLPRGQLLLAQSYTPTYIGELLSTPPLEQTHKKRDPKNSAFCLAGSWRTKNTHHSSPSTRSRYESGVALLILRAYPLVRVFFFFARKIYDFGVHCLLARSNRSFRLVSGVDTRYSRIGLDFGCVIFCMEQLG